MLNCASYISGLQHDRYNPRIIEVTEAEEDQEIQDFYRANPCNLEKKKAAEYETNLGEAIHMAERSMGSILCFQQMKEMNAIEFGRRISTLRSTKTMAAEDATEFGPSSSFCGSAKSSFPTFVKVKQGTPAILTQKSWETINGTDSESEEEKEGSDSDLVVVSTTNAATNAPRTRSWRNLRKTISKEELVIVKEEKKRSRCVLGRCLFTRNRSRNNDDIKRSQSFAKVTPVKESPTEQQQKKKGWGIVRRQKKATTSTAKAPSSEALIPLVLPIEISTEAEEEGFFLNDNSAPVSEDKQEKSVDASMVESMEVMDNESCFDIIGASNILKGIETSWKELTEDNFDIVPRRH